MRISNMFAAALAISASAFFPFRSGAVGSSDSVAIQYHFAGAADLAANTNFDRARKIFSLPPARQFQDLVLDRLAGNIWSALQFDPAGDSTVLLRPMLNDLLQAETTGSFGGRDKGHMDFVLAARLDAKSADAWQKNLESALRGKGEALTVESFSGRSWNRAGNHSFWMLRARNWVVIGCGEDLLPIRAQYLQGIKQDNRPVAAAKDNWLSADVDWPFLATWAPLDSCPLKPARTTLDVTCSYGRMRAKAYVTYPEAVEWAPQPWRVPKDLIGGPLSSFCASRNIAAYLKPNPSLSRLSSDPLTNQLFCWAGREMALQSHAAWPVADATNTLRALGAEAPGILNPFLEARNHTKLSWKPESDELIWNLPELTAPMLKPAKDANGDYLTAKVFPMDPKHEAVSDQLWAQFEPREDMVYYDWELTGLRLTQWRLLTELLPVFSPPTPRDIARREQAAKKAKPPALAGQPQSPLDITEAWLEELGWPGLGLGNTVTEVVRTSATELTVERNSQFMLTGLELVMLSHWLADAPVGPVDFNLLPKAKMTPGLPGAH